MVPSTFPISSPGFPNLQQDRTGHMVAMVERERERERGRVE